MGTPGLFSSFLVPGPLHPRVAQILGSRPQGPRAGLLLLSARGSCPCYGVLASSFALNKRHPRPSHRIFGTFHSRGCGDLSRLVVMRHSDDDFSPSVTCF